LITVMAIKLYKFYFRWEMQRILQLTQYAQGEIARKPLKENTYKERVSFYLGLLNFSN
jgi:hypothetical protein